MVLKKSVRIVSTTSKSMRHQVKLASGAVKNKGKYELLATIFY